ncbi:hypothetical protein BKP35_08070 [Anaerobacillus arseniciselenatis]|uniref:GGDEF domain-containing protein n=1 Tax=Anaerobacillus arseniciselenatis TaxID=85682 RepID=A0A1S2LP64_9BACI|nr:diguanylate cyclase [Anaerobacillus arseniciselenatis]OIJ14144.1 hypothetical protein BKP35_08070 [Anaerobacillus arseniciselenatis]
MNEIFKEYEPLISNCDETKEKIKLLNKLSEDLERSKPLHSLFLAEEAYDIALKEDDQKGVVKSLLQIGRSLWLTGDLEKALEKLIDGLERARALEEENEYEVEILNALGNVNIYLKSYDRALEYYSEALNLATAIHYEKLIAALLNNIGEIYYRLQDYRAALKYYKDSLKLFEREKEQYLQAIGLINIGASHLGLREFEQAEKYILKSLAVSKAEKDKIRESISYHLLGRLAYEKGKSEEARKYFDQFLKVNREVKDVFLEVEVYIDYYKLEKDANEMERALDCLYKGLELAEKIKAEDLVIQLCSFLAEVYETLGNHDKMIYYYKKFHDRTKGISSVATQSKLRSIAMQLKAEESKRKNKAFQILNEQLEQKTKELSKSYSQMKVISEIGKSITATLDINKVFRRLYENIKNLLDADVFGIGMYDEAKQAIEYKLYIEEGQAAPEFEIPLSSTSSYAVWCIKNKEEVIINDVEQEYQKYLDGINSTFGNIKPSLIFCPLIVEGKTIGVVTVQSKHKNAYNQYSLDSIRALVSYIAIAINNAQKSEELAEEITMRKQSQLELKNMNNKLQKLSELDGLTCIPNRRIFDTAFEKEWEKAVREEQPLSLLIIDIDQFKEYNDHYGHQEGDKALVEVAQTLQNTPKRKTDLIARYGGDEFAAILPNTDHKGAIKVAEKMIKNITSLKIEHQCSKVASYITLTVGAATIIPQSGMKKDTVMRMADDALYMAKEKGRNRVSHWSV